jgi:EAL domain-containing protein (putative c-di-GMP-specific phosphodiesterase class I)
VNSSIVNLRQYFEAANTNGQGRPMFRYEEFHRIGASGGDFPACEVLFNHHNCEDFFRNVRDMDHSTETDVYLFRQALAMMRKEGIRTFSFNIDLSTALNADFAARASLIASELGFYNKSDIVLEITEHAAIPDGADLEILGRIRQMGFRIAIDDFNPFDDEMVARFEQLIPYADIVKFDHSVGDRFQDGDWEGVSTTIAAYRQAYPEKILVLEGVSKQAHGNQDSYVYALRDAGIDVAQIYTPQARAKQPVCYHLDDTADAPTSFRFFARACV